MRIYFVRHAQSEANVTRVLSTRGWKYPLTPRGREQAGVLGDELAGRGIGSIWSSPLQRAIETAAILAARLGVSITTDAALGEYDVGICEDRSDDEAWALLRSVEGRWDAGDLDARIPGGESCREIRARMQTFIASTRQRYDGQDPVLVMVGHGGAFCRGLPAVLDNISPVFASSHGLANTSVVEAVSNGSTLVCVNWDDMPVD